MATKEPGSRKPRRKKTEPAAPPAIHSPSNSFARTTVPPQLGDPDKRAKWALPPVGSVDETGPYIVELNVEHIGGLPGAAVAFLDLYDKLVRSEDAAPGNKARRREPLRLTKSYYRCDFTDRDWHRIVAADARVLRLVTDGPDDPAA